MLRLKNNKLMSQQRVESSSRLGRETWAASKTKHPTSKSISPVRKRLISLTRQRKNLDAISEVHTGSTVEGSFVASRRFALSLTVLSGVGVYLLVVPNTVGKTFSARACPGMPRAHFPQVHANGSADRNFLAHLMWECVMSA